MSHERLTQCAALAAATPSPERWTAEEWLQIHACYVASGRDVPPSEWTEAQVALALALGVPPRFDDKGAPVERLTRDDRALPTANRPRSVVRDEVMRALVVGHAVEAYAAEQWRVFQGWAELLDEAGKLALIAELRRR